jgi:TolB protein
VGAKYLIKAQIEGSGKGKYSISYRLYDVNLRKNIEVNRQEVSVSAGRVRSATHRFVNEVIRAITGMPGPFGGRILFAQKTGNSTKAVYAIDVDGFGRSKLSEEGSIFMLPSQSGKNLLYTGFEEDGPALFLNGKRISPAGKACRGGRVSPGGKHIAVSMDEEGQSDIFLMTLEGEIVSNLTNHWADEVSPVWSPDGSMITFVSNRTGAPQIYIMNKDGSGTRRVTYAGGYNSTPSFGPGGMLAFSGMDDFQYDIFLVDMSGTITRLTQDQGNNRDPAISPDGRHIAFISDREGSPKIFISTIDGRYQFPITNKGGNFSTLFWVR